MDTKKDAFGVCVALCVFGVQIPVADFAESIPDIKEESIRMVGYEGASYERYTDDGVSRI